MNSARVLDEIGVLAQVERHGVEPDALIMRSYKDGSVLNNMRFTPYLREKYGFPYLLIHRAELRRILYDEAKVHGIPLLLGININPETSDLPNGVVRFTRGENETEDKNVEELRADLIIGADGAHSMCRETLTKRPNRVQSTGTCVNRIVIDAASLRDHPSLHDLISPPNVHAWLGPSSFTTCYLLHGQFNIVLTRPADVDEIFLGPRPVDIGELRQFFSNWEPRIRDLLEVGSIFQKWTLLEIDNPSAGSWVHPRGKLVLAGDSAHAILPYLYVHPT